MDRRPRFSIITPVYNGRQYLPRCVESVLGQTCGEYEYIIVDDGSRDGTDMLCDGYAARDERVRLIRQLNGGALDARLRGLNASTGEWVLFLDADDWWEPELLERMEEIIAASAPDMILFGSRSVRGRGEETGRVAPGAPVPLCAGAERDALLEGVFAGENGLCPGAMCVAGDIARYFQPDAERAAGLVLYGDLVLAYMWLLEAGRVACTDEVLHDRREDAAGSLSAVHARDAAWHLDRAYRTVAVYMGLRGYTDSAVMDALCRGYAERFFDYIRRVTLNTGKLVPPGESRWARLREACLWPVAREVLSRKELLGKKRGRRLLAALLKRRLFPLLFAAELCAQSWERARAALRGVTAEKRKKAATESRGEEEGL